MDTEQHSGCYRDVAMAPVDVVSSVASFVSREWGERYIIGYVGRWSHPAAPDQDQSDTRYYVFQVRAGDGSRFLVACTLWGRPMHCKGESWLKFARAYDVEAYV